MNKPAKFAIVAGLIVVVGAVLASKQAGRNKTTAPCCSPVVELAVTTNSTSGTASIVAVTQKLPKLVDLGAGKCIPCKMMKPILDDLKANYADHFITDFVDVWEDPDAGKPYGVQVIPTQIFFDANGEELFRHEGFFGKEDILNKWKELGVDASGKPSAGIVRNTPVAPDTRARDEVCFMCDGDVNPQTRTLVKGQSEHRVLCSPHCYFIYLSSIVNADVKTEEAKVSVTDYDGGGLVPATTRGTAFALGKAG